ncbi:hypothetical protein IP68_11655 [Blastomonas sp. AAP25]|jgi:hypothetical protein|uniref:hypothetical protein n=1 Tax=Blastomonas sp. AAP25 TaxID=1523416 RepID=UPI0006B92823|nr:hypothetical protein [Blastomonas sp. AAP25]KPF74818.1 hypothetical protein IP68_11655 [Blastomonas sp. AAP25]
MLAGALLLLAQPDAALAAPPESPPCPAATITFAPPLDTPLVLIRRIERPLANGIFIQTVTYAVSFTHSGRGYRMRWQQTGQQVEAPSELLRLLSLEGESAADEILDFTIDAGGTLLGVTESPDAPERLRQAIDRLRSDPALVARPEREQVAIAAVLDRLAALPPPERAGVHMVKASRLLMLAGRPCRSGQLTSADGARFRLGSLTGETLGFSSAQDETRPDGAQLSTSIAGTLSLRSGLVENQDRRMTSTVEGTSRLFRESLTLEAPATDPG